MPKSYQIIFINIIPPKTSSIIHHCLYLYCTYFDASFINVGKHIAKCEFKKNCVNSKCVPSSGRSTTFLVKNDMTYVQAIMCPEDGLPREHRIVVDCVRKEHAIACICYRAEVLMEPYERDRKRQATQIVDLLQAKYFELNEIRETLKAVSARIQFVSETGIESSKKN